MVGGRIGLSQSTPEEGWKGAPGGTKRNGIETAEYYISPNEHVFGSLAFYLPSPPMTIVLDTTRPQKEANGLCIELHRTH